MLIKRISFRVLTPTNHFGILVELENGSKYVLHNSPGNINSKGTHEIIVREEVLNYKWEAVSEWHEVKQNVNITELIMPVKYKFYKSNCIHTVNRIWGKLIPGGRINYYLDFRDITGY